MATCTTLLLRPGVYEAPQGTLTATPRRIRHWASQFAAMERQGIRVPVSWGHQPAALPGDTADRASKQYWLSAFNAGYLAGMPISPSGKLEGKLDCPGCEVEDGKLVAWRRLPDGSEVKSAIGEVSVAIKDWRDGKGKLWKDSIVHVALTPLPVVAGQPGFTATLGTETGGAFYLSTTTLKRELSMADEDLDRTDETPDEGDETPDETPDVDTTPDEGGGTGKGANINEVLRVLEAHGLHLPPDTDFSDLAERICVAGHAKAKGEGTDDEEGNAMPDDEDEQHPEDEGEEYNGPSEEEARPVLMSLSTARTETEKRLIVREQERHRKGLLKLVDRLVVRGLPIHKANEYRNRLSSYSLSLTEAGDLHPKAIDRELSLCDELLPKKKGGFGQLLKGSGRVQPRPDEPRSNRKSQEKMGDELAALAGANLSRP